MSKFRSKRFSHLHLDIVGPLPKSEGMSYIFSIFDRKSRWLECIPVPEATSRSCADAFIRNWIPTFGLPTSAISDNGKSFIAKLWRDIHEKLGIMVSYTPVHHPASLGHLERQHRELKNGLKAILLKMANDHQDRWCEALPWVLLNRHTVYQQDLDASAAEMVLGQCPKIPGDLATHNQDDYPDIKSLLTHLKQNAAKEPIQTSFHKKPYVYWPASADKATHVYVRCGKPTPLGPAFEGPYPITKKLGTTCLEVEMGFLANGNPRLETVHWENCQPGVLRPGTLNAQRPKLGRKCKERTEPYSA